LSLSEQTLLHHVFMQEQYHSI